MSDVEIRPHACDAQLRAAADQAEEDRADHRDPDRAADLPHGVDDAGGGAGVLDRHFGEDELIDRRDHETHADSGDDQRRDHLPRRQLAAEMPDGRDEQPRSPTAITSGPAETMLRPKRGTRSGPDEPAETATPSEKGIPVSPAFSTE